MASVNFQTVRLSRGWHDTPEEGACVMELASMIAGEPFSDHPQCACPVIATFLRSYNDSIDDDRRRDLYQYAARVVDSCGSAEVQRARSDRLAAWGRQMGHRRWSWSLRPAWVRAISTSLVLPWMVGASPRLIEWSLTDETHAAVLSVLEELLTIGTTEAADLPLGRSVPPVGTAEAV